MTSPAKCVPVKAKAVLVFGSINMDMVVQTPRFLRPGETLTGDTFYTAPAGKGLNGQMGMEDLAQLPEGLYHLIDWITPNESEAAALVGFPIQSEAEAARAGSALHERRIPNVVIKMGGRGAYLSPGAAANRYAESNVSRRCSQVQCLETLDSRFIIPTGENCAFCL